MTTTGVLASLVGVVLLATACADGGDSADGTVELVLFGGPVEAAAYQQMVDAFEAQHPDIPARMTSIATQDELMARLTTSFAGGAPPDVFLLNFRKYGQFAAQGALHPVQELLDTSEVLSVDDYYRAPFDAFRFDGQALTCMPQNLSSLVVYYNVELFEQRGVAPPEPGWTWDDLLAAGQDLTGDGTYGIGIEPSIIRLAPFVWSNGGEVVDDGDDPTTLTLRDGPAREALDFFIDLSLVHEVVPGDAAEQSLDAESRFARGDLGMYLDSRKVVPDLRESADITWDVAPLPVAPGGQPATILHSDAYCLSEGTDVELGWELVEFAESVAGQSILARTGRTVPSLKEVARSEAFLRPDVPPASAEVYLDNADIARTTPHTATWPRVEKEADTVLAEIFYGRIDRETGIERLHAVTTPLFAGP